MTPSHPSRVEELLVDRATEGLDRERQQELAALLATSDRAATELDAEGLELAAAAIELAHTRITEPLPAALRERVVRQAERYFGASDPQPAGSQPSGAT